MVRVLTTNIKVVDTPKVGWDKRTELGALQDDIIVEEEEEEVAVNTIMVEATLY